MSGGTDHNLYQVWGSSGSDVYVVSGYGPILHYDGSSWSSMSSGTSENLRAVWGSSSSDVYAVGGAILHFDGSAWSRMRSCASPYHGLRGVWGSSDGDVYAVGDWGTILHHRSEPRVALFLPLVTNSSAP